MQVYIGIDWSEKKHDVVLMNDQGAVITQMVIEHTRDGFSKLDQACDRLGTKPGDVLFGLETAHNLLIDHLWDRGYRRVYVVPPNVVKSNQGRFGSSGSINDPKAARLIADILRTDQSRLIPWHPDSLLTRQMRAKVSLILHLTKQATRISNRLRAVLLRYYPAALEIFTDGLGCQITLAWIQSYPNPRAANQVDLGAFKAFTQEHHYPQKWVSGAYTRLKANYPDSSLEIQTIFEAEAVLLAEMLLEVRQSENQQRKELHALFRQHPNYPVFSSLPAGKEFLGAALCAKFGDDRQRFPQANDVQVLAGTCPVTKASGKSRRVQFRTGCDREWRSICQLWAKALILGGASDLASTYFTQVLKANPSISHAYRCLANRWMAIAWKLWQTGKPYEVTYHLQQVAARRKPRG